MRPGWVDAAKTDACGLVQAFCTATEARDEDSAPQDVLHGFTSPHSRLTRGAVAMTVKTREVYPGRRRRGLGWVGVDG
jgi:hypothetical protein